MVHTVGRLEDLRDLQARGASDGVRPRIVLELVTSMLRHGFTAAGLREAGRALTGCRLEGVALHLPLAADQVPEVERLLTDIVAAGLPTRTVHVSHLSDVELAAVRSTWPDYTFRPRVGTGLWLGDRGALDVRATVIDAHPLARGQRFGYRQRSAPRAGTLLVVSGGTAHGIGLEAPTGDRSFRSRAGSLARGGLDASGLVRSPYTVDGKQRFFAEPPHMQASMLFLPSGATVLDVHEVERGDVFGYRGRSAPKAGHLLVVSGGTAHGIGLEAPTGDHSMRARAATLARGGLDAVGFVRSPYTVDGKLRLFAEPPHMQASMLFLPQGPRVPVVGEEIGVRVRHTITRFDRVVVS